METQDQKKIHINPEFYSAGGQRVKPKVHFNPAFLKKSTASEGKAPTVPKTLDRPVSGSLIQGNHNYNLNAATSVIQGNENYNYNAPTTSYNVPEVQHLPVQQLSSNTFASYEPSPTTNPHQTVTNTYSYGQINHGQYKYSKHNLYNPNSPPSPQRQSSVQTGSAVVKPRSAYSWSTSSHNTLSTTSPTARHSYVTKPSSFNINHGNRATMSLFSSINHDNRALVSSSHIPTTSVSPYSTKYVHKTSGSSYSTNHFYTTTASSKATVTSNLTLKRKCSGAQSESSANVRQPSNFKFVRGVNPRAPSSKSTLICAPGKAEPVLASHKVFKLKEADNRDKTKAEGETITTSVKTEKTSLAKSKDTSQNANILVNPQFLQHLSSKSTGQSVAVNISPGTPSSSTQKMAVMSPVLVASRNKDKYKIISKTKLVRHNRTPRRKSESINEVETQANSSGAFCMSHNFTKSTKPFSFRSYKIQSPAASSSKRLAKKSFSIISRTKLVRSQSGSGSIAVPGKSKYTFKTKTKLVRSRSNQNISSKAVDFKIVPSKAIDFKTVPTKADAERKSKFKILSKTKIVRRRSNSGPSKTKPTRSPGRVIPTHPGKRTIIKRHKLVRNASVSPHQWSKRSPKSSRIKTFNTAYKITNNGFKLSVNQKLAKGILSKYKINRLKSEPFVVSSQVNPRRSKSLTTGSNSSAVKHSDRFINIGGILYKSTQTTLRKQPARGRSTNIPTTARPHDRCSVVLRGVKFQVDGGGRTLRRVGGVGGQVNKNKRGDYSAGLPRLYLGGRTYSRTTTTGLYNLTTTHTTKAILSSARQRSLSTLLNQRRKKGSVQKRNQFCVFFNRFGRCSKKEVGECPFLHDPKRVAVCTRFLRGRCPVQTCPFSHSVDPDKMPVCSHFLRSVCTRDPCPYRHVRVNPQAPICLQFLRGCCADGAECKKQHVLVCEEFQETGKCPRGSSCPLSHHRSRKTIRTGSSRPTNTDSKKKHNYTFFRKRNKSESDVLGRPKPKKKSERKSNIHASKAPRQRYFNAIQIDVIGTQEGQVEESASAEDKDSLGSTLDHSEATNPTPGTCLNTEPSDGVGDINKTRLRILKKVDKLKKIYSSHSKFGTSKTSECSLSHPETKCSKDENVFSGDIVSDSEVVQRPCLPKRLPSYISLTMDEDVQDV